MNIFVKSNLISSNMGRHSSLIFSENFLACSAILYPQLEIGHTAVSYIFILSVFVNIASQLLQSTPWAIKNVQVLFLG